MRRIAASVGNYYEQAAEGLVNALTGEVKFYFTWTVMRVISMGRRNTKLELAWHRKQKRKLLAGLGPSGTLPWLCLDRVQPNRWFSRESIVESMHWMVLHRPVELAALTGQMKPNLKSPVKQACVGHNNMRASWEVVALKQPLSCAEATTETSGYGMLVR